MASAQDTDRESPGRVLFVYWGRRGIVGRIAAEIAAAAAESQDGDAVSFSPEGEAAARIAEAGASAWQFPTFRRGSGTITGLPRFFRQRRALLQSLAAGRFDAVVVLMSHVWTPLLGPAVRAAGMRYAVVLHDARPHPGDASARLNRWLRRDLRHADLVITLSEAVAALLAEDGVSPRRIATVPHPAISWGAVQRTSDGGPLRLLFLGRILRYKGLPQLVEAVEILRARGIAVTLGVYGEGDLDDLRPRLDRLGAVVVNRWIDEAEIAGILSAHDVMVLPHVEASQSGVAAVAHGAAMPVVATPVGGLGEQVRHGIDGLLAEAVSAEALADAIGLIATEPALLVRLREGARDSGAFGPVAFARRLKELVLATPRQSRTTG